MLRSRELNAYVYPSLPCRARSREEKARAKQLEEGVFTIGFKGVRQTLEGTKRYDVYLARVYIFFFYCKYQE